MLLSLRAQQQPRVIFLGSSSANPQYGAYRFARSLLLGLIVATAEQVNSTFLDSGNQALNLHEAHESLVPIVRDGNWASEVIRRRCSVVDISKT